MSLIIEDGTGSATAESYISVTGADTYHSNIGNAAWPLLTTAQREQCLRKATAFMSGRYRERWAGSRKSTTQALDWPRSLTPIKDAPNFRGNSASYYSDTSVPAGVSNACASLALRASVADLLADETRSKVSVSVGPISTTYDPYSSMAVQYKEIDAMLAPYLKNAGNQVEMVRV